MKVLASERMHRNRNVCVLEDSMCTIVENCVSIFVEEMYKQCGRYFGITVDGKMIEVIFLEDCSFERQWIFEYKMN